MDRDLWFLLVGAGIALGSSVVTAIVTALVRHSLSLRADRIMRERDRKEEEQEKREKLARVGVGSLRSQVGELRSQPPDKVTMSWGYDPESPAVDANDIADFLSSYSGFLDQEEDSDA